MQLAQYFKKSASGIILPMLFGFLPLTLCNSTKAAIAFSVFAVFSVVFTIVPLLFAGKMQLQHGDTPNDDDAEVDSSDRRRVKLLCFAAYASNVSLMGTAVCLATVINKWYWALAIPLLLVVVLLFGIFFDCGLRNDFVWGAMQYDEHRHDLKFFFDLSSEVTQTAFAGLSGSLLGNLKKARCLQNSSGTAEGFTLYALLVGLFLMLVCTIPPALDLRSMRDKAVAVFLKWTAYLALALLTLAGLFAAATVVRTFVVFAVVLIGAMGAFWFYKVYRSKPPSETVAVHPRCRPDAEARHAAGERSLMWLGIHTLMFGTLMASYSVFLTGQHFSDLYKAGVFFVFAVLLTNFCRMVLVRENDPHVLD
uniref:Uncharacterized protein n=1 Tax=Setaria italica TaxID=4555 RepID=K3YN62_SETIT